MVTTVVESRGKLISVQTTSADRVGIIKNANGRKHIAQDSDKDIEDA